MATALVELGIATVSPFLTGIGDWSARFTDVNHPLQEIGYGHTESDAVRDLIAQVGVGSYHRLPSGQWSASVDLA